MRTPAALKYALGVILLLLLLSTVFGVVLDQPIGLSYVETGSMEPTISTGDGFIAIPTAITGDIDEGDIIVFDAVNLNDGGVVTHRVVDETASGYITRGDANIVTDQDGIEPPVSEVQVVAKVLVIGDWPVVIPNLGVAVQGSSSMIQWVQQQLAVVLGTRAVLGTRGISYILLGFGVTTYVLSSIADRSKKNNSRKTRRSTGVINPRTVIVIMTVLLILTLSASMLVPGGVHKFQFVSSDSSVAGPDVIQKGTTESVEYRVPSNGQIPVVAVVRPLTDDIEVSESRLYIHSDSVENVTVNITAPPDTGVHTEAIVEHRYHAFLPMPAIIQLHTIHPWLPLVILNLLVSCLFIAVAILLIGIDPIRIGRRQSNIPLRTRIRRRFE